MEHDVNFECLIFFSQYIPRFRLKGMGNCASLTVKEEERTPLFLTDIQHLLMYSMLGHHSPYHPSR